MRIRRRVLRFFCEEMRLPLAVGGLEVNQALFSLPPRQVKQVALAYGGPGIDVETQVHGMGAIASPLMCCPSAHPSFL